MRLNDERRKIMSAIKYCTVKSALPKLIGKHTGQVISNGTVTLDEIAMKVCRDRPAVDEPEFRLSVRAIAAEVRNEVGENLNYVTTGSLCAFAPAISGSLPAMDSPLGEDNVPYVNIVPLSAISAAIGAITPTRESDNNAIKIILDNVEDRLSQKRGTIIGTNEFVITGLNLSASDEGESIQLVKPDGSLASEVTIKDEEGCGQRIIAQLATSVEPGTYILVVNTHGYTTPENAVDTYARKVSAIGGA